MSGVDMVDIEDVYFSIQYLLALLTTCLVSAWVLHIHVGRLGVLTTLSHRLSSLKQLKGISVWCMLSDWDLYIVHVSYVIGTAWGRCIWFELRCTELVRCRMSVFGILNGKVDDIWAVLRLCCRDSSSVVSFDFLVISVFRFRLILNFCAFLSLGRIVMFALY